MMFVAFIGFLGLALGLKMYRKTKSEDLVFSGLFSLFILFSFGCGFVIPTIVEVTKTMEIEPVSLENGLIRKGPYGSDYKLMTITRKSYLTMKDGVNEYFLLYKDNVLTHGKNIEELGKALKE